MVNLPELSVILKLINDESLRDNKVTVTSATAFCESVSKVVPVTVPLRCDLARIAVVKRQRSRKTDLISGF